jgi:hypothetical protein
MDSRKELTAMMFPAILAHNIKNRGIADFNEPVFIVSSATNY